MNNQIRTYSLPTFVKKEIDKDGNPKQSGEYDTDCARIFYNSYTVSWETIGKRIYCKPTYYFEEQSKEQITDDLPTDEQIKAREAKHGDYFMAQWMRKIASLIICKLKEELLAHGQNAELAWNLVEGYKKQLEVKDKEIQLLKSQIK